MKNFRSYLLEQVTTKQPEQPSGKHLKSIPHLEDLPIHFGHQGVSEAADTLEGVHKKLLGKSSPYHISTKYDGAPSVVFGNHPGNGKFFVATKSAFNKNPKLNYSHEDIEANHGHAPGLVKALKGAYDHLPKIMPKNGGVYQGDLMYHSKADVKDDSGKYHFTPNTISYSAKKSSEQGKAIGKAKLGIAVHTKYVGKGTGFGDAQYLDDKTRAMFQDHEHVHNISPAIQPDPVNYSPEEQTEFHTHMESARASYARMKPEGLDNVSKHATHLEGHVNDMVRKGGKPSVEGLVDHITTRHKKEVSKLLKESAINTRSDAHSKTIKNIMDNKEHFRKLLETHGHLQNAKNVLTRVVAKSNPFSHHINGVETHPEGAVVVDKKGVMTKFVDRGEFSRQNFLKGGF